MKPEVDNALAPLRARWRALPPRERWLLVLCGLVIGLYLLWLLALQPAISTVRSAPATLDTLELQLQGMQQLATEVDALRATPPVSAEQAAAALRAATERMGEQGQLSLQADRAVLTLNNASTSALRDWLTEARSGARARPLEAALTRGAQGFSGTLVVVMNGAAP